MYSSACNHMLVSFCLLYGLFIHFKIKSLRSRNIVPSHFETEIYDKTAINVIICKLVFNYKENYLKLFADIVLCESW
jgi:hypothetical protein